MIDATSSMVPLLTTPFTAQHLLGAHTAFTALSLTTCPLPFCPVSYNMASISQGQTSHPPHFFSPQLLGMVPFRNEVSKLHLRFSKSKLREIKDTWQSTKQCTLKCSTGKVHFTSSILETIKGEIAMEWGFQVHRVILFLKQGLMYPKLAWNVASEDLGLLSFWPTPSCTD